jgi:hypothetical protein
MTATAEDSSCIAPVTYMEYPAHATKLQKIVRGVRAEGWGRGADMRRRPTVAHPLSSRRR